MGRLVVALPAADFLAALPPRIAMGPTSRPPVREGPLNRKGLPGVGKTVLPPFFFQPAGPTVEPPTLPDPPVLLSALLPP
eukprot:11892256-Heterocapsa_arctica.AAC.1